MDDYTVMDHVEAAHEAAKARHQQALDDFVAARTKLDAALLEAIEFEKLFDATKAVTND